MLFCSLGRFSPSHCGTWRRSTLTCRRIDDDMGRTHELEHSAIKCMRGILYCYMRQSDKVSPQMKRQTIGPQETLQFILSDLNKCHYPVMNIDFQQTQKLSLMGGKLKISVLLLIFSVLMLQWFTISHFDWFYLYADGIIQRSPKCFSLNRTLV